MISWIAPWHVGHIVNLKAEVGRNEGWLDCRKIHTNDFTVRILLGKISGTTSDLSLQHSENPNIAQMPVPQPTSSALLTLSSSGARKSLPSFAKV
jgi:hypothetical protein